MFQARSSLAITSEFAERNHLDFRFARIPRDYQFDGPLNFEADSMRALFEYGVQQGANGRLWTTPERFVAQITNPPQGEARQETQPIN